MTQDDIKKNIDIVLNEIFNTTTSTNEAVIKYKFSRFSDIDELIEIMSVLGIIELTTKANRGNRIILLTNFGHEVLRHGSWTKYLADKEEEKRLANEMVKSTIMTNKTTRIILYVTIIISALSAWISWLDYAKTNPEPSGQKKFQHNSGGHHHRNQEAVLPNEDSSANHVIDSSRQKIK